MRDSSTDKNAAMAIAQPAHALKQTSTGSINYVADYIMDVLDDLVGRVEDDIVVETSIDPALQLLAERALVEELQAKGPKLGVEQGAIVSMSPDGAVRAMVGGRDYAESQYNRAVAAKRQPGSAFKPFVYLTALERGLTPDTIREDKPVVVKGWRPENYTREYYGPVTLTQALAMSLNTVSVRLTLEFGPNAVTRTAHRLGIASKLEPNASIGLGTSEVSVLEMVSAFATFANNGMGIAPHVIESVRGKDGKVRYQRIPQSLGQIVEPRYVAMMNTMMQETLLSGTGRKADLGRPPGRGQDRHQPGFPRRLVRRLHRAARHRRMARQRRFLADQEDDRRRIAVGNLGALHEGRASQCGGRQSARQPGRHLCAAGPCRSGPFAVTGTGAARLDPRRPLGGGPAVAQRRHGFLADRPAVRTALITALRRLRGQREPEAAKHDQPAIDSTRRSRPATRSMLVADHHDCAEDRGTELRRKAEQRRRGSGALGDSRQAAGNRLRKDQTEAERDRSPLAAIKRNGGIDVERHDRTHRPRRPLSSRTAPTPTVRAIPMRNTIRDAIKAPIR